jgi:ubiquinol-cytochrome c reductase iron-sulfur subunit
MMAATASRRLLLRVALKLLVLAALGALAIAFFGSLLPPPRPAESLSLPVTGLAPEQLLRTRWHGQRLLVLRRSPAVREQLAGLDSALADPRSRASQQPPAMENALRSAEAEFFLALDYDPDFGCPLDYVPPAGPAPFSLWAGGFHSPCSDSWFDPAGRVYRDQRTHHNLIVPPHRFVEGQLAVDE